MSLEAPNGQILYNDVKKQYDRFTWTTDSPGVYTVCFSNEFSTFSHKLVYMDFQVGDTDDELPGVNKQATAMTQVCFFFMDFSHSVLRILRVIQYFLPYSVNIN